MILTPDQVVMALLQASRELGVQLTRDELVGLTEIPSRESGYDTTAHNPNRATGDDSYGLWQVNMLGSMGTSRARALGIKDYSELFDPVTNAKAAVQMVIAGRKQGDPLRAWGGYKGMSNTYNVSSSAAQMAQTAVDRVGAGVAGGGNQFLSTLRQKVYGSSDAASPASASLVSWLNSQIGKPYIAGTGVNPNASGWDCSGLIATAYSTLGIELPPLTFTMKNYGQQITDYSKLQPGDMLYVHGSQGDFGHVGIYIGNNQVIDSPHTGAFVRTQPLSAWLPRIQSVNRVMDADGRVIIGGGLVPKSRAGIAQVPVSQARTVGDQAFMVPGFANTDPGFGAQNSNTTGDAFAVPGATQPKIIEDRQPFILPGLGRAMEPV